MQRDDQKELEKTSFSYINSTLLQEQETTFHDCLLFKIVTTIKGK